MKKYLLSLALIATTFTTSCSKKIDTNKKILKIATTSEIKGMDPIYANDLYSGTEVARVYEGLLEYHYLKRPYTLIPNLAEAMPTVEDNGLTYKFKIKSGVLFHDDPAFPEGKGRELTAEDFVYSIKRLADPKLQSLGWWVLDGKIKGLDEWREKNAKLDKVNYSENIEGIEALDKYTIQFKLKKSFPQFLYSLSMPFTFVVAKEVAEKYGTEFLNHPVGTGPFILPTFSQNNRLEYKKNPTYRKVYYPTEASEEFNSFAFLEDKGKELPLVEEIHVEIMKESQPRWLSFIKGKIDFIGIPKDNFDAAITPDRELTNSLKEKGIVLDRSTSLDVTYVAFNHDIEIFKNIKLRRAMSQAYNPDESNSLFFNNTAVVAHSLIPPGIAGNIPGYVNPYVGENIEEAKKNLKEAGYPDGLGLPELTYDTVATTTGRQQGEFFKKQMAKIGIKIQIISNPWPQFQAKITNRQVQLFGIAWGADYPDAENFHQLLFGPNKSPGSNGSGYDNPEFNQLYNSASVMQDSPERTALYEKMTRIAAEEVPWIFGVHRQNFTVRHGWLKNYIPSDFDWGQSKYLNVDIEKKKLLIKNL